MGIHDNPARERLPENPRQPDHRKTARINDIPQHIPRPHRRKLVDIPHKDQPHPRRNRLHQGIHQNDINHGALIYNQHIAL